MKKLAFICIAVLLSSCTVDEVLNQVFDEPIGVEESISEGYIIPPLEQGASVLEPIVIETSRVNDRLEGTNVVSLSEFGVQDVEIVMDDPDGNFNFLDSIEVSVSSASLPNTRVASLNDVPQNRSTLTLTLIDDVSSLTDALEDEEFSLNINVVTNQATDYEIPVDIISDILVYLDIEF